MCRNEAQGIWLLTLLSSKQSWHLWCFLGLNCGPLLLSQNKAFVVFQMISMDPSKYKTLWFSLDLIIASLAISLLLMIGISWPQRRPVAVPRNSDTVLGYSGYWPSSDLCTHISKWPLICSYFDLDLETKPLTHP